jgi:hypothetical protein
MTWELFVILPLAFMGLVECIGDLFFAGIIGFLVLAAFSVFRSL